MRIALETNRLLLRPIEENDTQTIFDNWASKEEVTRFLTWDAHSDVEVTKMIMKKWLEEYEDPKVVRCGIVLKETNELVGMIDVVDVDDEKPEIGYCSSPKVWGHGYMTEACRAFMQHLFDIGYQEITICANKDNIGSNRVIQKCGFSLTHEEDRIVKGKTVHMLCYSKKK